MISFKELNSQNELLLIAELCDGKPELSCDIHEIVSSFSDAYNGECSFGFCRVGEVLLVRIWDGETYTFVYPIALSDSVDERAALEEIRAYAVREEIPLIFCDVPKESVATLESIFRYTEAYDEEGDAESFSVCVLSELSRAVDIPILRNSEISLEPLCEGDISRYARLCKDSELNKYWGYDYREDIKAPDDRYFYGMACRAAEDGVALSLAVRCGESFAGEACLWGFDLLGSCELGFRILPEWQGRGLGKSVLELLIELGEELSLLEIRASVMRENLPSVAIVERKMTLYKQGDNVNKYVHKY